MKLLLTGANGFIGKNICIEALNRGYFVKAVARDTVDLAGIGFTKAIGRIDGSTPWKELLADIDFVIHCAARVHVIREKSKNPLEEFRKINVQGTLNLARQAALAGVRRFVFISSIKVNGESTQLGSPFHADDDPAPQDAYGVSKMEAELGLRALAAETGMEVVIIRPPLVYGPGVKANFAAMMRWLYRGIPLPLGAIYNKRSLVALDNLVDLILTCLTHPAAANQTFLVFDGEDVSTTELLSRMGQAMGKPARLVPVPAGLIKVVAKLIGKGDVAQRLCGSLQVDIEKTRRLLGWNPPLTLDQGLKKAAEGFKP
jgi:UDP-glucose 4-epimerase